MRINPSSIFIVLIIAGVIVFPACTRELTSGDEQPEQPWAFENIPAWGEQNGQNAQGGEMQLSAGQSEGGIAGLASETEGEAGNANIEALMNGGRAALINGDIELAIEYFNEVITLDENYTKALYNLGYSYRLLGDVERSIEYSRRAVESNPDELYVNQNLGFAYEANGQIDEAIASYEEELRRHPGETNLVGVAERLALIYLDKGLNQEAFDVANRAVNLQPDLASAHVTLAAVHIKNGAYGQAIEQLEQAVVLDPESASYRKSLADTLWDGGRQDDARQVYGEAILLDPEIAEEIEAERLPTEDVENEQQIPSDTPL